MKYTKTFKFKKRHAYVFPIGRNIKVIHSVTKNQVQIYSSLEHLQCTH